MTATYQILEGDVREQLATLPAESVHCCVTSVPYWGLRAYNTEPQVWADGWRGELGQEPTPDLYVAHMVEVFQAVRRVLRKDGTLWLNCGDSYATGAGRVGECPGGGEQGERWAGYRGTRDGSPKHTAGIGPMIQPNRMPLPGLKPKDLLLMPARLALALQADGWWLRSDIIWQKPTCMPGSQTDRPTSSHEHIFLLAKAERYFYDRWAIAEPSAGGNHGTAASFRRTASARGQVLQPGNTATHRPDREEVCYDGPTRNARDVWSIRSEASPFEHYAAFPPELPRRCILAGTSQAGVCPECGAPWARVEGNREGVRPPKRTRHPEGQHPFDDYHGRTPTVRHLTGAWAPTCTCDAGSPVPATVLDPFSGTGTTAAEALLLGRNGTGIELSPEYAEMSRTRCQAAANGRVLKRRRTEEIEGQLSLEEVNL
ncbi:MAG TPA: site-specific DNA-methyltransferase [Armatimonadota bacterium]